MANTTGRKYGGRTKGTLNKTTAETKELLLNVVGNELDKLGTLLNKLEPAERIAALTKLLPFVVPKHSEVTVGPIEEMTDEQRLTRLRVLAKKFIESDEKH